MKTTRIWFGLAILLSVSIGLYAQSLAQGQQILVNLPQEVNVGEKTLAPGQYEIRKESTANTVLRFFSKDKLVYETAALPIPDENRDRSEVADSKVVIQKVGDNFYMTRVWIEGASTGYELPLPDRARSLQRELAQSVTATTKTTASAPEATSVSAPAPASVSAPSAGSESIAESKGEPVERGDRAEREEPRAEIVQNSPPEPFQIAQAPAPEAQPTPAAVPQRPEPAPAAAPSPAPAPSVQAAPAQAAPDTLPATASNWAQFLLMGVALITMAAILLRS